METTRIIEKVDKSRLRNIISKYRNKIHVSSHAFFHINGAQRKVYNRESLIRTLKKENPVLIGLQKNGRYAFFYKRKDHYLRLIVDIKDNRVEVVTFINTDYLPNIKWTEK